MLSRDGLFSGFRGAPRPSASLVFADRATLLPGSPPAAFPGCQHPRDTGSASPRNRPPASSPVPPLSSPVPPQSLQEAARPPDTLLTPGEPVQSQQRHDTTPPGSAALPSLRPERAWNWLNPFAGRASSGGWANR